MKFLLSFFILGFSFFASGGPCSRGNTFVKCQTPLPINEAICETVNGSLICTLTVTDPDLILTKEVEEGFHWSSNLSEAIAKTLSYACYINESCKNRFKCAFTGNIYCDR